MPWLEPVPAIPSRRPFHVIESFEAMDTVRAIVGALSGSTGCLRWNERELHVIGWFFVVPIATFSLLFSGSWYPVQLSSSPAMRQSIGIEMTSGA